MAWQDEIIPIVRWNIGDTTSPLSYSDDRLEEVIVISAHYLIGEVDFENTYSADIDTVTISPDPTTLSTKDYDFINLVAIKAACFVLGSEVKTKAVQAFRITDGPSSIDTKGSFDSLQKFHEKMCEDYAMARINYQAGNSRAGRAILTPYTQERLYPSDFN